jgi:hypothetical protein
MTFKTIVFCDSIFYPLTQPLANDRENIHHPVKMTRFKVEPSWIQSVDTGEFECGICANILETPMSGCKNGHTFCKDCYEKWLAVNSTCPNCRTHVSTSTLHLNLPLMNLIAKLPAQCNNHSSGCAWTGELKDLYLHMTVCAFQCSVSCPICNTSVRLPHLQQHINEKHPNDDFLQVQSKIIQNQQLDIFRKNNRIRHVYMSGVNILYNAVFSPSTWNINTQGALINLIQTTQDLINVKDIVGTSCQTLACVLYNSDHTGALCRKVIIENNGIKMLYDCLEKYITHHDIVSSVSTCLSNVSVAGLKGSDKSLVESRGVNLLISCLKKFKTDSNISSMVCRAIRNHLQHEEVGCALVHSGGLEVILECNKINREHIQPLTESWFALGNVIMVYPTAKQSIFDHGAVDRAYDAMLHYVKTNGNPESAHSQAISDSVMWFLSKMICTCNRRNCQNKHLNERIAHVPFMETLLHAMEKHSKSHKVLTRGAMLIENMLYSVDWDNNNTHTYEDILKESKLLLESLYSRVSTVPSSRCVQEMIRHIDQILEKTWITVKRRKVIQKPNS